jgi:FkbM family methyltransferase
MFIGACFLTPMTKLQKLRRQIRLALEASLPSKFMSVIGFLYPPSMIIARSRQNLRRKKYRAATQNLPPDTILFKGLPPLRISPEARDGYEHFCWREERTVVEMRNFLHLTKNRRCLYDVGALHGVFSFAFASATGGQSFAFEPSPPAANVLQNVQALNPDLKVDHFPFAIGRESGELVMRMDWQHLIAVPEGATRDGCRRMQMQSVDQFASSHTAPDCMKVDVEGYEHEVLLGAINTLKTHRPILFLEIHPFLLAANGTSVSAVADLLKQLEYEILGADLRPFVFGVAGQDKLHVFNLVCK